MTRTKSDHEFLWGAATSSHQVEGDNFRNDWWDWESRGLCEGGVRSDKATDHWNRFREDLKLAAELGLNSYRFSVEWSRLEPEEGRWDAEAFDRYAEIISECEKNGLKPMLTLHHFTSPLWFAHQGGFASDAAPAKFAAFTREVARRIGSRVPLWCTINEPMVLVVGSYLGKFMPPGEFNPTKASAACANLLKCHVAAYDILHSELDDKAKAPVQVGFAHNMLDFLPDRPGHPMDLFLTGLFRRFYNRAWLDAVTGKKQHFGVFGLIPYARQVSQALKRVTVDFIGVNYYTKAYIHWRPKEPASERPAQLPIGVTFARRKEPVSDLDWAVHPAGLARMLRFVRRYGLPSYITENGIADRDDRLRPEYLRLHVQEIARARAQGMDIRGYYYWSLLDNFEWIKGFGPRFGLYRVNYETFERQTTESARVYRDLIQTGFSDAQRIQS